jgi:hypothetical protein
MIDSGRICHGIISALSVLYVIDLMYHKYNPRRTYSDIYEPHNINWNQTYFENDIVSACAAIFVHNLPSRCFQTALLDRTIAPLPYLLRLSDCMQDWDRPSANNPNGFQEREYSIDMINRTLVLSVNDPDRRDKIAQEIRESIMATDIEIR